MKYKHMSFSVHNITDFRHFRMPGLLLQLKTSLKYGTLL